MRFGYRAHSLKKRIAARTSHKRNIRRNFGLKAPRGMGFITYPKLAAYDRIYRGTTTGCITIPQRLLFFLVLARYAFYHYDSKIIHC